MMAAIRFSELSFLTKATLHHNPEDGILHFLHNVRLVNNLIEVEFFQSFRA
jgi:hypothetical protein